MSRRKSVLFFVAGLVCLVALFVGSAQWLIKPADFRHQIEAAGSRALGMQVTVGGQFLFAFFPPRLELENVNVSNNGSQLISAKRTTLGLQLIPLLHAELSVDRVALQDVSIVVHQDGDGRYSFQNSESSEHVDAGLELATLLLSNASLLFKAQDPWQTFQARDCDLGLHNLQAPHPQHADFMRNLSFNAQLACGEVETNDFTLSKLTASVDADGKVFRVEPISLHALDSNGSGRIVAHFSAGAPRWSAHFSLPRFSVDAFFRERSTQRPIASGSMDFSTTLTMRGSSVNEMKQTIEGDVFLRGNGLRLHGVDLDQELARFESSQNFNLVDLGAFFIAGPLGLLVTKGYNFASILVDSEGTSDIDTLVSKWQIKNGRLRTQDAAMATKLNRIAARGSLDFMNARYDDFTVAVVDSNGCARVQQMLSGPFDEPIVEKPNILRSLAGPVLQLLKKGEGLLGTDVCKAFYSGSVPAPGSKPPGPAVARESI